MAAHMEYDVLVVGTGASGMATAVTAASQGLKVLVVEKAPVYGGTTARSGGWLWVPGTHLAIEQGLHEPAGAARAYLQDQAGSHFDPARVDAFIENGPKPSTSSLATPACSSTCRRSSRITTPKRLVAFRAAVLWSHVPLTPASSARM